MFTINISDMICMIQMTDRDQARFVFVLNVINQI